MALAQVNSNPIRDSIGGGEMSLGKQSNSAQPQRNEAAPQSSLAREAAQPLHENSTRQGPIPGPAGTCGRGGGSSFDALPDPPSFPLPERPAVFRSEAPGGSVQLPSLPIHLPDESEDKSSEALLDFSELEKEAEKAEIEALKVRNDLIISSSCSRLQPHPPVSLSPALAAA